MVQNPFNSWRRQLGMAPVIDHRRRGIQKSALSILLIRNQHIIG
jgi:hypothetical protein